MSLTEELLTLTGHELGDLPRQDPAAAPFPMCSHPHISKAERSRQLLSQRGGEMKGPAHPHRGPAEISARPTQQAPGPLLLHQEQRGKWPSDHQSRGRPARQIGSASWSLGAPGPGARALEPPHEPPPGTTGPEAGVPVVILVSPVCIWKQAARDAIWPPTGQWACLSNKCPEPRSLRPVVPRRPLLTFLRVQSQSFESGSPVKSKKPKDINTEGKSDSSSNGRLQPGS